LKTKGARSGTSASLKRGESSPGGSAAPKRSLQPEKDLQPSISWRAAVKALAISFGLEPRQLLDEFERRVESRWYQGDSPELASAAAYEDIRERLGAAQEAA
jgi:hypothetical protein